MQLAQDLRMVFHVFGSTSRDFEVKKRCYLLFKEGDEAWDKKAMLPKATDSL